MDGLLYDRLLPDKLLRSASMTCTTSPSSWSRVPTWSLSHLGIMAPRNLGSLPLTCTSPSCDPTAYLRELHASRLPKFIPLNDPISISMYAGTFVVIHKLFRSFLYEHCCNDEGFIGSVPTFTGTPHIIHSDFVIFHYAFHQQYSDGTLLQKIRPLP